MRTDNAYWLSQIKIKIVAHTLNVCSVLPYVKTSWKSIERISNNFYSKEKAGYENRNFGTKLSQNFHKPPLYYTYVTNRDTFHTRRVFNIQKHNVF